MNRVEQAARDLVADIDFQSIGMTDSWKSFAAVPLSHRTMRALIEAVHYELYACRGCRKAIEPANIANRTADGCPCNSGRGINHGLVPKWSCTCKECDPNETGSARSPELS